MKYKAILFHPAGDYVTDFPANTKEEVWDMVSNSGSRWIFYPIPFVISNSDTRYDDAIIVSCPEGMEYMKRKKVKTLVKVLQKEWDTRPQDICDALNDGYPLYAIY